MGQSRRFSEVRFLPHSVRKADMTGPGFPIALQADTCDRSLPVSGLTRRHDFSCMRDYATPTPEERDGERSDCQQDDADAVEVCGPRQTDDGREEVCCESALNLYSSYPFSHAANCEKTA
jgi:hypothetical protein